MKDCPKCGGECFDNTKKVAEGWKGPLHKCKDQGCGWVQWPPKGPKGAPSNGGKPSPRVTYTWEELGNTYAKCAGIAKKVWTPGPSRDGNPTAEMVAATATLFIQAMSSGMKVEKPKPEPMDDEPPY